MRRNVKLCFIAVLAVALLGLTIPAWAGTETVRTTDITLSSSGTIQLTVGEWVTVRAAVAPKDSTQPVVWSSSDRSVATVKDGVVKARGKGIASISARSGDKAATVRVKVSGIGIVKTTKITLSPSKAFKLEVGNKATIQAVVEPEDSTQPVKWSSSDEEVAKVSGKGVVTARGKGKATITAKSGNKKARVRVTVTEKTVKTTKVILSPSATVKLNIGEKTTIKATVKPKNSTQSVKWSSSDEKVARVSGKGVVTAMGKGTAVITARSGAKKARVKVRVRGPVQPDPTVTATAEPAVTDMPEPVITAVPDPTATAAPEPTATPAPAPTEAEQPAAEKVLVAYFSCTGTTGGVARKLANVTGGDLYEIVPTEPYTAEDLDYGDRSNRATYEQDHPDSRPKIGSKRVDLAGYTTLYLGYPIWWGMAPRILCTFVESYDFTGITVIPFCTSGSSGIGASGSDLAKLAGTGNWLNGARHSGSISESELRDWVNSMK